VGAVAFPASSERSEMTSFSDDDIETRRTDVEGHASTPSDMDDQDDTDTDADDADADSTDSDTDSTDPS
jgi:hypothetical protein